MRAPWSVPGGHRAGPAIVGDGRYREPLPRLAVRNAVRTSGRGCAVRAGRARREDDDRGEDRDEQVDERLEVPVPVVDLLGEEQAVGHGDDHPGEHLRERPVALVLRADEGAGEPVGEHLLGVAAQVAEQRLRRRLLLLAGQAHAVPDPQEVRGVEEGPGPLHQDGAQQRVALIGPDRGGPGRLVS